MSILSYKGLVDLVEQGVITGVGPESINGTSIDVHLGNNFLIEDEPATDYPAFPFVDLSRRECPQFRSVVCPDGSPCMILQPGEFALAHTKEVFHLPADISAQFLLKSSVARSGLGHALATWADPTWHNSTLTLELHNNLRFHTLGLAPGMPIGQMIFHRHAAVPDHASYAMRGRYNHDAEAQPQKP